MDENTQTFIDNLVKSNEWLKAAEYSWRSQAQEAAALLEATLSFYSLREPTAEDYKQAVENMAKIRAFLRRIGKQP